MIYTKFLYKDRTYCMILFYAYDKSVCKKKKKQKRRVNDATDRQKEPTVVFT